MHNLSDDMVAELRLRLHDFMLGFARVDAIGMSKLEQGDWALAARIEQLRRHPLVKMFDDELLGAIAVRAINPNEDARYLAARLREAEAEAAAELTPPAAPAVAAKWAGREAVLPAKAIEQMEATIALIARQHLGVQTLVERNSDRLDFYDCSVWGIRAALAEAYEEGWHAAP